MEGRTQWCPVKFRDTFYCRLLLHEVAQEFHLMTYKFHFMTDKFHLMTEPTTTMINFNYVNGSRLAE